MKYAGDSIEGCAISKQNIYCKKAQGAAQPHDLYDINLKKWSYILNLQLASYNSQINIEATHIG